MANTERGPKHHEVLHSPKNIVLFIDDNIEMLKDGFSELKSESNDLQFEFYDPSKILKLDDQSYGNVSLIVADQFFNEFEKANHVSAVIDRVRGKNPNVVVIETSYLPSNRLRYVGSVGVFDTIKLVRLSEEAAPKTALAFIEKLKWKSNYAFRQADNLDSISVDENDFIETFTKIINIYDRLSKDKNFGKLLELTNSSDDMFVGAFMSDNNILRRKVFLHLSWQIIGHISIKSDESFYTMSVQRLKELLNEEINF